MTPEEIVDVGQRQAIRRSPKHSLYLVGYRIAQRVAEYEPR
jgi:hypothetical protein